MATVRTKSAATDIDYPTSDGRPKAETEVHRDDMIDLIESLKDWYKDVPRVCVSGNMLMYYVPGNKRKHLAPDVFIAFGVEKKVRDYYLVWQEGKGPDAVIELTSSSTRAEDTKKKFLLYQDVLKVREYFLFDPKADYLDPPLLGYRLEHGKYVPISRVRDRLPSKVLGLHLERSGAQLRLFDPAKGEWLPTRQELVDATRLEVTKAKLAALGAQGEAAAARTEALQAQSAQFRAEAELAREALARLQAEAELARLREEQGRRNGGRG